MDRAMQMVESVVNGVSPADVLDEANIKQIVANVLKALMKFEGQTINRSVAAKAAQGVYAALDIRPKDQTRAFKEIVDSILVRKNLKMTAEIAKERANNITAMRDEYGED